MKRILLTLVLIAGTAVMSLAQDNFAHVNSQALLDTMDSYKAANEQMRQFEASGIKELQEMQVALSAKEQSLRDGAKTMAPIVIEMKQNELQADYARLQQRDQELQGQMQQVSYQLNQPILERVKEAIKIVSEREKIDYVMDVSGMLYYKEANDITEKVIVELLKLEAAAATAIAAPGAQ
ncbi:MAG: OmpH family outer membrane protein [Crocinitomicaceae bacterium]|nr:OmpH family outer membrane protein [Crocinitomicaceae bacterium]